MKEIDDNPRGNDPYVAYGIDVGMYEHGSKGVVNANTTFAWARVTQGIELRFDDNGNLFFEGGEATQGRDIRDLARLLSQDIRESVRSRVRVAIGMEAPMWQPTPRRLPQGAFDLFPSRFEQEAGYWWHLQSGASATVRALSIGRLLFSLLDIPRNLTQFATGPTYSTCIELFEGFVAGDWKLPRDITRYPNGHCWDALTTAAAFQIALRGGSEGESVVLHSAMSLTEPFISHWKTIVGSTGLYTKYCDTDCMVLGIDSRSLTKPELKSEN
jgi:hypothetical protein